MKAMNRFEQTAMRIGIEFGVMIAGERPPPSPGVVEEQFWLSLTKALHRDVGRVETRLGNLTPSLVTELIHSMDETLVGALHSTLRVLYPNTVEALREERDRREKEKVPA